MNEFRAELVKKEAERALLLISWHAASAVFLSLPMWAQLYAPRRTTRGQVIILCDG